MKAEPHLNYVRLLPENPLEADFLRTLEGRAALVKVSHGSDESTYATFSLVVGDGTIELEDGRAAWDEVKPLPIPTQEQFSPGYQKPPASPAPPPPKPPPLQPETRSR